jgi:hypothetical protein
MTMQNRSGSQKVASPIAWKMENSSLAKIRKYPEY